MIVGQTISSAALGAVGATGAVAFLVFGFFFGLTGGFSVITAQRFGARDYDGMRRSVATGTLLCIAGTALVTAVCVPTTRLLLNFMRTPPELLDQACEYLSVIYWGIASLALYNLLANFIRALGDSRTPLIFLIVACVLNIGLDFLFILGFGWGVAGAAWATVVSQLLSGIACLVFVAVRFPILHLHRRDWRWDWSFALEHLAVAIPMALQFAITAVGVIVLQVGLNELGATVVTAFAAASRVDQLAIQPMISFGVAMATFAAQNYGARRYERIASGVRQCALISMLACIAGGLVVIVFGRPLMQLFVKEGGEEIVRAALTYLRISACFYLVLGLLFIYRNTLQGMGRTVVPMLAGVAELVARVGGTLFLIDRWGFVGACLITPFAWIGATVLLFAAYWSVMRRLRRPQPVAADFSAVQADATGLP